jgi:hypothetical protein
MAIKGLEKCYDCLHVCVCLILLTCFYFMVFLSLCINMPFLCFLDTYGLPPTFLSSWQTNPVIVKNLSRKVQACFDKWRILIRWVCRNKGSIYNEVFIPPGLWIAREAFLLGSRKHGMNIRNTVQPRTLECWVCQIHGNQKASVNVPYFTKHNTAAGWKQDSLMC